ncbi:nucleotide exchange factor GrpE [Candidatus Woesearchaeota archaeon]|nr:nucleotide exchange factor GrpE [Candidatus Woesearchaeota archaeon]
MRKNKEDHTITKDSGENTTQKSTAQETAATETASVSNPLEEMTDLLKRTQANFENYRKQMEKRMADIQLMAGRDILLEIIPLLDHFELVLKNAEHAPQDEFMTGIKLIHAQFMAVLEKHDLKVIDTNYKIFDPRYHEALLKVESEQPENTILEEFQKGFTLHGQVIRHAKVKLSAGPKKNENQVKHNVQSNKNDK